MLQKWLLFVHFSYWRWRWWFWWLWCYYKGNIKDLLVIPVLSPTISHLTPTGHYFFTTIWSCPKAIYFQQNLLNIWKGLNPRIFEGRHFKRTYLLLWVLSTIMAFKERIWDFLKSEKALHRTLLVHTGPFLSFSPMYEFLLQNQCLCLTILFAEKELKRQIGLFCVPVWPVAIQEPVYNVFPTFWPVTVK